MSDQDVSAIILSAGLSSRMAQPKALLSFGHTTFIENIYKEFSIVSQMIITVVSPQLYYKLKEKDILTDAEYVFNQRPALGRFYSVFLGVKKLGPVNTFVQNIDTPGVSHETLALMIEAIAPGAYVVPVYQGRRGHPVLLSKEITHEILNIQKDYELVNLKRFLSQFKSVEVEVDDEFITLNINTPSDLELLHKKIYNFEN